MVALVGANGAGKSTLLKVISGLLRQSSGTIEYEGEALPSSTAARVRAGIAQVPEGRQVFADLTIEENLRLGAYSQLRSLSEAEVQARVEEVCSIFPILKERMKGLAGGLSGGQQQMLSIGRGLMAKPRLLLLDEPSLGLSPTLVTEIFRTLVKLRGMGVSILLAEQNARMSLAIADRGYVIETGKIALSGTGQELLHSDEVMERYLGVGSDETHGAAAEGRALGERLRAILLENGAVA
jgi:branched-chain amino acid transport system ATP-binding protein